jgi:glutamyl-tRNA synthetase
LQSERISLYRSHVDLLLKPGHAYRCFCSSERLDALNRQRNNLGLPLGYDRTCTNISQSESDSRAAAGEHHVVRFQAFDKGYPVYKDLVYGKVGRPNLQGTEVYDDPILVKSDGHPTYHFANVVDDHHMQITHVIRGGVSLALNAKNQAKNKNTGVDIFHTSAPGLI